MEVLPYWLLDEHNIFGDGDVCLICSVTVVALLFVPTFLLVLAKKNHRPMRDKIVLVAPSSALSTLMK